MQIEYQENGKIFIHQETQCKKILNRFNTLEFNPTGVPIEKESITAEESAALPSNVLYREAVGSLMFLAVVFFDLAFHMLLVFFLKCWINLNSSIGTQ